MIDLSYSKVLSVAESLATEKGFDYVYTPEGGERHRLMACHNFHEDIHGNPSEGCIVGTILHRMGVEFGDMVKASGASGLLLHLARWGVITYDEKTRRFLKIAQIAQDAGATWYSAVKVADAVLGLMEDC